MSAFRSILHNAGWNLLGNLMPMLTGLLAVPYLVKQLGTERFGLLSLGWILIGYFGLFDFGLGRALTKMVAERWRGGRDDPALESLCSTGLAMGCAAGLAACWWRWAPSAARCGSRAGRPPCSMKRAARS
jgi:O-antigen/teichoic acid export membrane protein